VGRWACSSNGKKRCKCDCARSAAVSLGHSSYHRVNGHRASTVPDNLCSPVPSASAIYDHCACAKIGFEDVSATGGESRRRIYLLRRRCGRGGATWTAGRTGDVSGTGEAATGRAARRRRAAEGATTDDGTLRCVKLADKSDMMTTYRARQCDGNDVHGPARPVPHTAASRQQHVAISVCWSSANRTTCVRPCARTAVNSRNNGFRRQVLLNSKY